MFGLGNSIYAHSRSNIIMLFSQKKKKNYNVKNLMMFMLGQIVKNVITVFGISRKH